MPRIAFVLFLLFTGLAAGQTFSFLDDSLQPHNGQNQQIKASLTNYTNSSLKIDSVFFRFLGYYSLNNFPLNISVLKKNSTVDSIVYSFDSLINNSDSLFFSKRYYSTGKIELHSKDTISIGNFEAHGMICGFPGYVEYSKTKRFAFLIFKSGQISDTITIMGDLAIWIGVRNNTGRNTPVSSPLFTLKAAIGNRSLAVTGSELFNLIGRKIPDPGIRTIPNGIFILSNQNATMSKK